MISLLLCGVSAAAITASLSAVPITWDSVFSTGYSSSAGNYSAALNRTFLCVYSPETPQQASSKIRLSFLASSAGGYTLSKVYVGEVTATRSGYMFQSAPTPVTFDGGSASVSVPVASSKLSDEVDFDFSGGYKLGVAFIITAATASVRRHLNDATIPWTTYDAAGDNFPDPPNTGLVQTPFTQVLILSSLEVVFEDIVPVNRIKASSAAISVIKEGCSPVQDNAIRTVNQSFYVVKS